MPGVLINVILLTGLWAVTASSDRHGHHPRFSLAEADSESSESSESFSLAVLTPDNPLSTYSPSHHHDSKHRPQNKDHRTPSGEKLPNLLLKGSWGAQYNGTKPKHHHDKYNKLSWNRSRKTRRHEKLSPFHGHHRHHSQQIKREKEPFFDKSSPSVVTAQIGQHAFLSCRIHDLEDKSVSWIRNKDAHILTVDRYTFIADSRFVSWFDADSETWTLQMKFTTSEDAGRYECQVSTEPKRSHFVTLSVIVPLVVIPGGSELHVRSGSDVVLKCVISKALVPPPYVFWYHDNKRVPDGEIVRQTPLKKVTKDSSVASLSIKNAEQHHAGNYTCAPAGLTTSASVLLHVINGEHPAAMQHGSSGVRTVNASFSSNHISHLIILVFTYFLSNL